MHTNTIACNCNIIHKETVKNVKENILDDNTSGSLALFFKIFADATRIKILSALDKSEMCVCDLAASLNMTKSAISHQLALLKRASLVKSRRDGKEIFYSLSDDHIKMIVEVGLEHISE